MDHPQDLDHQRLRSGQIPFQPAHVRRTDKRLETGLEIQHGLVRWDGIGQASLLHERVAKEAVIVRKVTDFDQPPGQGLRFLEAVELMQDMPAQKHGIRRVRSLGRDDQSALLGQLVAPVVILCPGLGDEKPAELFNGRQTHLRWLGGPTDNALFVDDFLIQHRVTRTRLWSEDKLERRGTRDVGSGR